MTTFTNPLGIRRADHVGWTVAQLGEAIVFYQRVFGAQLLYRLGPIDAADIPREANGVLCRCQQASADQERYSALL